MKLSDGKYLGGAGRLTYARIDYFQMLYRKAIVDNAGDAEAMSQQTLAILHHYSHPPVHTYCKKEKCSTLQNPANPKEYKNLLPPAVKAELMPIFQNLSSVKLLEGCLKLQTQNQNEAFHHVLWGFVPKDQVQAPVAVKQALNLATLVYNRGYVYTFTKISSALDIPLSQYAKRGYHHIDNNRCIQSRYHSVPSEKESHMARRYAKRKTIDGFKQVEGTTYKKGVAHRELERSKARKPSTCRTCGQLLKGHPKKCPLLNM